jgi:Phospholipase_D-nuclease N-terminal
MGRLIPLLFLLEVALVAVALISCLSAEDGEIRTLPRVAWIFIILLFPLVGAVAWFSAGRPVPATDGVRIGEWGGGYGSGLRAAGRFERSRPHRRPVAPDDDPEFLRSLDIEQAKRDRELFRRWEDDLLRRDDDQNPHPPPPDTPA